MARKRVESRIHLTNIRREQLLDRCKGKCCHCGCELKLGDNFSIEHIIPLAKGGTNEFKNTVALCKDCNKEKGDDIVSAEFYSYAPKLVYADIEQVLNDYYDSVDWLTPTNVFKHDRYTIKTQQSIMLPNGKIMFRDAQVEMKKMDMDEYESFAGNIETRKIVEVGSDDGDEIEVSSEGTPFKITFKGKPVASIFCGLAVKRDRAEFRMMLTISKDTNWGPSSRGVILDCIHEAITQFRRSVEEKGTKGIALCHVDVRANDKRAVSVLDALQRLWSSPKGILSDPETNAAVYFRISCAVSFNIEVEAENGMVSVEEFSKKSKLYGGQLKRRINSNS